ncbi:23S rRNA pseudouridine(2604) synthase RluF [Gilvimarinus sp. SDUM040013]|uniref:Pseudouridine synthase n=1 Tax=Gilvimarinus gilvus TaxID=3058038 RepID=A0ABU4S6R8_9GAMM|nr:23S rRNA pseudouridine(2604) synthase RluF [Gilvimarinus sp. SDUM040013]MDO3385846.1 23S rRNA pseudouridine(2604) synthase RluF [Gilvimarinus sp. SDUM040013]MDX6851139.1 23S rRNA pseudouridine(2604) synthase RluF [Gilvimarinus sp. SDUM040013]
MLNTSLTRLNKYISESGMCSRRDADRYIEQGNVYLNGKRAQVGDQVAPGDVVRVNGQLIEPQEAEDLIFIALNKPVGIVSTTESSERDNIVNFVRHSTRIFPIGRLDKDSQGLIFLTNNGDLVNKILRAGNNHEKEYLVTVNKPIRDDFITGMSQGVPILGTMTKKCKVSKESPTVFRITLVQGLNRQIRRMCEHFGYEVVRLERVKIMNVGLKGLPVGEWRDLTQKELKVLLASIEDSSSEAPAGRKNSQKSAPHKARGQGKPKAGGKKTIAGGNKKSAAVGGKRSGPKAGGGGKNKPAGGGKPASKSSRHNTGAPSKGGANKPGGKNKPGSRSRQKPARSGPKKPRR